MQPRIILEILRPLAPSLWYCIFGGGLELAFCVDGLVFGGCVAILRNVVWKEVVACWFYTPRSVCGAECSENSPCSTFTSLTY